MHGRFLIIGLAAMAAFAAQPALGETVTLDATIAAAANTVATSSDHQEGSGAWQANGTSKAELYLTPELLFGGPVAVNQIAGIKYHTKKAGDQGTPDWYISVYTVPFTGGDSSWYGHRLTFEPIYANGLNAPAGQWNQWTTDAPTNQLTVFDSNRTVIGFYNGPTLADLTAGELNWGAYPTSDCTETVDYSGETIKYIVVSTGNPWANGFTGLVDALEITLTDSTTVLVDLENAPAVWVDDDFNSSTPGWGITHFATIQGGINAVDVGGTVNVAAGTYVEAVTLSKRVILDGAGSGTDPAVDTIINGNGAIGVLVSAGGASATQRLILSDLRIVNGSNGIRTQSDTDFITLQNVSVTSCSSYGFEIHNIADVDDLTIDSCSFSGNGGMGMRVRGSLRGLVATNCHFDNNLGAGGSGIQSVKSCGDGTEFTGVQFESCTFNGNPLKGMYFEKLSHATFTNIEVKGSGTAGAYATGIDINLKYGNYENIAFNNLTLLNSGTGDLVNGCGLVAKGRNDSGYASCPASLTNVSVNCAAISGSPIGLSFGNNVNGVVVDNASLAGNWGGLVNWTDAGSVVAENNWWGTADGAQIAAMVAGTVDYDPCLTTPPDCQPNVLYLTPKTESIYVKFGEQVVIDMNVANLTTMVNGCQALLGYSSLYFPTAGTVAPGGGGVWTELIYQSWAVADELDTAIGVQMEGGPAGTNADGTVAVITLTAGTTEGRTRMVFRPDGEGGYATMFSDLAANPVWPTKLDSVNVTIDNTAPVITVPDDATVTEAQYSMAASATDALAGIASFTMNGAAFTSPTVVTLVPGINTFTFVATDRAGNSATEEVVITYNQAAPTIDVFHAIAPNAYAGSSSYNAWLANSIVGARDKTSPVGDAGYAQYKDLGAAVQDYAAAMVTSFRSWMGLITSDNEWGSRTTYVYRIDNGVQTNPGAAKLNLDHIAVTWKWNLLGADAPADNYTYDFSYNWTTAPRATLTFAAGPQRLKGYNWDGSQWVEVTSGREADLIIYNNGEGYEPEKLPGNVLKPATQDTLNELYKQLTGAVPCIDSPRQTVSDSNFVVSYAGHAGVADVSSADVGFKYNTVDATAPVVTLTVPTDGAKLNSAALTITGTATDNEILASGIRRVEIKLNGTQVYLNTTQDNVSFAQAVTLAEGSNSIEVIATDFAGNTATASRTVLLDTVAPTIGNLTAVQMRGAVVAPTIDGAIGAGEWAGATQIAVASGKGTVSVLSDADYLYVLFNVADSTDARLGQNIKGNDQTGINVNPTAGAPWGLPCALIFQTGNDAAAWGGVDSGASDGWKTCLKVDGTQLMSLPADLVTKTIFSGGTRIAEWKIPLSLIGAETGDPLQVGGAIDIGDGNSYLYPSNLNWGDVGTYVATEVNPPLPVDVLNCANPTLQGVVNISVDAADASAGLVVPPAVTVTMGSETLVVSYVDQSPAGTFNYTVEVDETTANGTWTIAATATDEAGNTASTSGTLCINKNQVTGTVSFATLSSAAYSVTRNVVLAATDSGGAVLKTWTVPVAFTNNAQTASGAYTLTDVPATMANLSADTAWALRKRQAVTPDGNGQTAASFTLLGGDINSDNFVNILDYSVLKNNWNTSNAVADINGDGMVGTADYSILKANWFVRGDAQ